MKVLVLLKNCKISDCNRTQTHNHLVCKQTLSHSAKLAKSFLKCVHDIIRTYSQLQNILPKQALLTIYKSFVRPHLHYGYMPMAKLKLNVFVKN